MEPMVMEAMKEVLRTGQEMERRGLVAGTSGNYSARVHDCNLVIITPSSMEYDLLLAEDMCVVDMAGEKVEGRYNPSVEVVMHLSLIHISEPTRLGMISYAVFCLKKKKKEHENQSISH